MSLDQATVGRIARLARIDLDDRAQASLQQELSNILTWIERLNDVSTDHVEPMRSVIVAEQRLRDDVVRDGDKRDAVLANAPKALDGAFVVPKVVE